MNISDKIDEIRRKPEHIRMRYVWFSVAISMLLVITLWVLSLSVSQQENSPAPPGTNPFDSDILNQFGEQKNAFNETQKEVKNSLSELEKMAPDASSAGGQNNQSETNLNNGTGQ